MDDADVFDDHGHVCGEDAVGDEEQRLAECFQRLVALSDIDVRRNFLEPSVRAGYDNCPLTALLGRMPKGGLLHLHKSGGIDFQDAAALAVTERLHCHVVPPSVTARHGCSNLPRMQDCPVELAAPFIEYRDPCKTSSSSISGNRASVSATDGDTTNKMSQTGHDTTLVHWTSLGLNQKEMSALLYGYLTQETGSGGHVLEGHWEEFESCWTVLGKLDEEMWWDKLLPRMLRQLSADNVTYIEVKMAVVPSDHSSTEALDSWLEETVQRFATAVVTHQNKHDPRWLGAKIVFVGLKHENPRLLGEALRRVVPLKQRHPEWVAGIDLAGEEDASRPLSNYTDELLQVKADAAAAGVELPFLLHAGESNLSHNSTIIDAMQLGVERIGHGLMLPRYPDLMTRAKEFGIPSVEVCPIANQVLGYTPNLQSHPGIIMIRNGLRVTINNDAPGMWGYGGCLRYDFAAATVAWGLGLAEVKQLVRNSILCSTLASDRKANVLADLMRQWDEWVKRELHLQTQTQVQLANGVQRTRL